MGDLYERLLAKVAAFTDDPPRCTGDRPWFCGADDYELAVAAVRAVLELHKPAPCLRPCSLRHEHVTCRWCKSSWRDALPVPPFWPCDTVRAVARALDIEIGDQHG